MSNATKAPDVEPVALTPDQRFEALRMRYEDHVELLRVMTGLDLRLVSGVMAIQLALGGWLATNPVAEWLPLVGVLLLDGALAFIGAVLLHNNALRRREAIATLKNVMTALGFYRANFYVQGITINAAGGTRLWGPWYIRGIVVAYIGLILVAVFAKLAG